MRLFDLRGPGLYGVMCTGVEEAVAIAGIVTAVAGAGYGAYSAKKQAGYAADVADENARQGLVAAADAINRGDIEADAQRLRTRLLIGQQRAGFAASGVEVGSGSPLSTTQDAAMFGEMDVLTIKNNAEREAWGYQADAANFRSQARANRLAGNANAGATLLTGASSALGQYSAGLQSGTFSTRRTTKPAGSSPGSAPGWM